MTFTYDLATTIGQVRLLIPDRDSGAVFFQDDEINVFLALNNNNVYLAAALALDTMASNEAYVQKRIRLMDLSTDGVGTAAELRARAAALREQSRAADADAGELFDIAETNVDPFTARQIVHNQALRDQ
jgi:hypothetical protein